VSNLLRLNQLNDDVKQLVQLGHLDMGHARTLLAVEPSEQLSIAETVIAKKLNVRQTEQLVKKYLTPPVEVKKANNDPETEALSERLSEKLGSQVSIVRSINGKTKLTISIDEPHKLKQVVAILEG
jgi:ParB family chromosome partitioning protein